MSATDLFDPKRYAIFRRLELIAHSVVEGFVTGMHKSPFKGFAIEFDHHRQYVAGDDLKHLDWKLVGKLDRYYIKQYEEDTSLRAYLVLDISGSMNYGSAKYTKFDYGRFLVGVFSFMLLQQQDSVGLVTCDNEIRHFISPRSSRQHMKHILDVITAITPGAETGLGKSLHTLANKIRRRALIVIFSDLFDKPEDLILALNHFAHKKHEVILYQVLDRKEEDFPFTDLTRFVSMEGESFELVDPLRLRKEYLHQFREHQAKIRRTCHQLGIDFQQIYTADPFERTVAAYMAGRLRR